MPSLVAVCIVVSVGRPEPALSWNHHALAWNIKLTHNGRNGRNTPHQQF